MHKRLFGLLAAAVIVVTACGGTASNPPATQAPAGSAASQAPAGSAARSAIPSADFRFALDGEPTYFSPAENDLPTSWIVGLMYLGLLTVNNKGETVPSVASAVPDVSADGLTFTVHLRKDVMWTDGTPLTSADALFSFQIALSDKCSFNPSYCSVWHDNVKSVTAPDDSTIVITMKAKYAPFYILGLASSPIVPKAATEASYKKFSTGATAVTSADTAALVKKINDATSAKGCSATTPPASCDVATYTAEMEAILTKAGVTLPDKARYTTTDASGATVPDTEGYASALQTQLGDLDTTLAASETDKMAAAYRLLDINLAPVSDGAYKLGTYKPGESVELLRNDTYAFFLPSPAKVEIPIIKDAKAASDALASNQIDWQTEVTDSDSLAKLKTVSTVKLSEYPDLGYYYIAFNVRPGHVFSDVVARQAFSECIDQKTTVTTATDNNGVPVKAEVVPASQFYDTNVPDYKFDVADAKSKLEADGWVLGADKIYAKGGVKLSADLRVRKGRPQRIKFAELARDQLSDCGIKLNVIETDFSLLLSQILVFPNKFDIYLGGWANLLDPEDTSLFGCDHVTTSTNTDDNNFTGYCDKKVDDLLAAAKGELDVAKRKADLAQLQEYLHDNGPYYFLWADLAHRGYSTAVTTNGAEGPIDYTTFYDFWNNDSWLIKQQ